MPEMLPCPLRLPRASTNPIFSPDDFTNFEQVPNANALVQGQLNSEVSQNFHHHHHHHHAPMESNQADRGRSSEDENYQHLSDFSSMMADLKLRENKQSR